MSGTGLALKIGSLVLGVGIFLTLLKRVKGLKKFGIASLLYVFFISLILALPTLLMFSENSNEVKLLIINQAFIIALGTLHVIISKKLLPWFGDQPFKMQIIFIICILLFGYLFSNIAFTFFVTSKVELVWAISLLWFLVPILLNLAIIKLLEVPQKEFKKWQYPIGVNIEDPTDEEMENPVVISFVFLKNKQSLNTTIFRAKAPVGMSLGRLFYFFINDYNSSHPEGLISYINEENKETEQWMFFKSKIKMLNIKEPLDPEDSIYGNNIKENDILICNRFIVNSKLPKNEATK